MNYHYTDSYKITSISTIESEINRLLTERLLSPTRTTKSYVKEWHAHNVLYKLGLFRSHTKDVDLNDDETFLKLFMYSLIWNFSFKEK